MKLDSMKRRIAALERQAGADVLVVDPAEPDAEKQRSAAAARGALVVLVDRDEVQRG